MEHGWKRSLQSWLFPCPYFLRDFRHRKTRSTLIAANALIGGLSLLILALLAARTRTEEQMLIARFGDAYRNYMATTGRYVPRIFR